VRENVLTLKAARLSGQGTPVFVTVHGPLSVKLDHLEGRRLRVRWQQVRRWYPRNRAVIAISEQTAADMREILGPELPILTIPNPVVAPELYAKAAMPIEHPWLRDPRGPVVVAAGRLEYEKDFGTLLRAFAFLRARVDARLLLFGEGGLRADLELERARLGLTDVVDMPGWAENPYPYLQAADLVVLSSFWDALPTVLIEALALGTPVVSTACGEGPGEILQGGRLGRLVEPRNPRALADAMAATLADPLPAGILRDGARRYHAQHNADRYRALMLDGSLDARPARGGA
jgi:glycosyltransferase involved in cell wall biosynthesis